MHLKVNWHLLSIVPGPLKGYISLLERATNPMNQLKQKQTNTHLIKHFFLNIGYAFLNKCGLDSKISSWELFRKQIYRGDFSYWFGSRRWS